MAPEKPLAVTSLTLSHFRSHKIARVHVDERPVAIFGANGAGKTNILEALSMLSPGRGLRRASASEMARRPDPIGWQLNADVVSGGAAHEIRTWSENGAARQVRIDDKQANQVALGQIVRVLWLIPAMDRLWIEGAEGRRRFLDRAVLSFDPGHAQIVLDYEKAMRERNRLLKDMVRDPHWYMALERQMAEAGAMIHRNRRDTLLKLEVAQQDGTTLFPAAALDLIQSEGGMPESATDLAEAIAESRFRDMAAGRTLVGPHRTDLHAVYAEKGIEAKDCSTGEQKALLVSLILANGRALSQQIGAPPILLLDEIAAHLDADRRAALYDEICGLGTQAWMTGTGAELFAELGSRAQHLHVSEATGIALQNPA